MTDATNEIERPSTPPPPPFESSTVVRERIASLIAANEARALIVCAPLGSGKTTAIRQYLASVEAAAYVRLSSATSVEAVDEMLAETSGVSVLAIDEVDAAPAEAVDALLEHIAHAADARRFILIGRSRSRMRAHRLLASGVAASLDSTVLSFSRDEATQLAAAFRSEYDEDSIVQLMHDTDGWPIALAWIVRDAVGTNRPVRGALERWIEARSHLLLELLTAEHARDADAFSAYKARLREGPDEAPAELERGEALGFPVVRTRTGFRPYRLLSRLLRPAPFLATPSSANVPTMTFNAFGCFRCEIGGRPLEFRRRRDRNILTYVALAPEGRVTRKQLIEAFWPDADRTVATQGLRTAFSRIRLAIADIVGPGFVDEYFRSSEDASINFDNVAFDVRRFTDNVRRGDIEYARGAIESAESYYVATDRIYRGALLASEALEPCFRTHVRKLEETYVEGLVRRVQFYTAAQEYAKARACACKLLERAHDEALRLRTMGFFDAIRFASA